MNTPVPKKRGWGRRLQQSEFFLDAVGKLGARHIRAVYATSKVIREPADTDSYLENLNPMIVAMWHGQFLLLPLIKPKTVPVSNMVAKHADGEIIGRTLLHFDMGLIRGAGAGESGKDRGGAGALRAALKALKANTTVAMTTDIPPGPARVAGMGIVTLARMSGRPIVPLAMATDRFITLPTWSRFTINLPFSNLAMVAGEPIHVPRDADESTMEEFRQEVEAAMNAATARAYELAGSDYRKTAPEDREGISIRLSLVRLSRRDLIGSPRRHDHSQKAGGAGKGSAGAPSGTSGNCRRAAPGWPAFLVSCGERGRDELHPSAHARVETPPSRAEPPAHDHHNNIRQDRRRSPPGGRDPSISAARQCGLLRPFPRSLASGRRAFCGIRNLAEPHCRGERPQGAARACQRADVAALIQAMVAAVEPFKACVLAVRSGSHAELALRKTPDGTWRPQDLHHRQPEIRCAAAAGGCACDG